MLVAWAAILAIVIGVCAIYGGRNCQAPTSGPFRRLLAGHEYVPTRSWRAGGCREVK